MSKSDDKPAAAAAAPATVRDNQFTFDGADDFGLSAVMRQVNSLSVEQVHAACGISLQQLVDALIGAFPAARRDYVSAVLEASSHNHNMLWDAYQTAAAVEHGGEMPAEAALQYPTRVWQVAEGAIAVAYTAAGPKRWPTLHPLLQALSAEHSKLAPLFRQGFQDAELAKRAELAAVYLHSMVTADFLYVAAIGAALEVPSPEVWPVPPEVWTPHRAQLASVEARTAAMRLQ